MEGGREADANMDSFETDDTWMSDPARNETRYAKLVEHSIFPPWTLFRESFREDPKLLFPRMLLLSMRTARYIPKAVLMKAGPERDDLVQSVFKEWGRDMCHLGQVRLDILGLDNVDPEETYLIAVNHMSPMDIPVISAALPMPAAYVANALFLKIPVFSYWMRKSGAIFVDQGHPEAEMHAFKEMIRRLKKGRSLILFPEGYINQGEGLAEFKRGGLHAAIFADIPILPLCLYGTQHVMRAGSLHVTPRTRVVAEFGEPIIPATLSRTERKDIERFVSCRLGAMKARHASDWHGSRHR
jgi:1-acyl-sn-glycerol-3-phosphate acyltransferase